MAAKDELMKMDDRLTGEVLASLVTRGDISGLQPGQKAAYYSQLCQRVGLDPATAPFQPLKLNGKEILYATKGAAEQLRNLHKISITIVAREKLDDVYYVTARATMQDGRTDESRGAVTIAGLKGDNLANAVMKAETKAKRRVTLSIVGLGMLDESELETIQPDRFAALRPEEPAAKVVSIEPKRPAASQSEALPEIPAKVTDIPPSILLAIKALHGLDGIPINEMTDDDLELVMDATTKFADQRKASGKISQRGLDWLAVIAGEAAAELTRRRLGDAPPPEAE